MRVKNNGLKLFIKYFFIFELAMTFSDPVYAAANHDSVEILVEDAAEPWSQPDGTGYANDIVVAAFQEMAVKVHLNVVPYARCKRMVLNGSAVACFSMTWVPEFEGIIKIAEHPLITLNADVFESIDKPLMKPKDGQCKIDKGLQVGIVNGYEYPEQVNSLLAGGVIFEKTRADSQSLQMLALGRLDAAIVTTNDLQPINRKLVEAKVDKKIRFAFNCGQETGSIGFSLKNPDGMWAYKTYEEGYSRLLKDQTILKKIHAKWFPKSDVAK